MRTRPTLARPLCLAATIVLAACSSETAPNSVEQTEETTIADESAEDLAVLPVRVGPRRETTGSVPHVQIDAEPVADLDAELRRRAFELPGVEDRASERSLPGARGLWFSEELDLERPDVIAGSREFAHIHPDGSLHVWLPVDRATELDDKKWGELHPWVDRDGFWDGVAMIYTVETPDELDVTIRLIVDAYNFITGSNLDPSDIT